MFLTFIYLLRVPLLVGALLFALPLVVVSGNPQGKSMLEGLFDLSGRGAGVAWFLTLMTAGSLAVCIELVLRYAPERFHGVPQSDWTSAVVFDFPRFGLFLRRDTLLNVAFAAVVIVPMAWALLEQRSLREAAPAALVSTTAFAAVTLAVTLVWAATPDRVTQWIGRVLRWTSSGYVSHTGSQVRVLPGHGFAMLMTAAFLLVYAGFGLTRWWLLACEAGGCDPASAVSRLANAFVPSTLACVLVLLTLICYAFAGVAFFFDRFRIPLLVPIAVLLVLAADWPQSDHYFPVTERGSAELGTPGQILQTAGNGAIVVAASGGGIHAAAWAAAVLAQLQEEHGGEFSSRLRLVSAVSGGSVGTMHVVAAMDRGAFDSQHAKQAAFEPAARSSLDEIAWGLVYPDLLRLVVPFLPRRDRGWAAEHAWATGRPELRDPMTRWSEPAVRGRLPAVIFNATLEETGGRLMMSNAAVPLLPAVGPGRTRGRVTFHELYPQLDVPIVTAARLSATFPIVSPAARLDAWVRFEDRYHVVDGGYYDNFGVSSLTEWLESALAGQTSVRHILVVQIRGPVALQDPAADSGRGFFHQLGAPLATLTRYRTAAQVAHNTTELRLLCLAAPDGVTIENAVFQFPVDNVPLSWHLTQPQIDEVWDLFRCGPERRARHVSREWCGRLALARMQVAEFLDRASKESSAGSARTPWPEREAACAQFAPASDEPAQSTPADALQPSSYGSTIQR